MSIINAYSFDGFMFVSDLIFRIIPCFSSGIDTKVFVSSVSAFRSRPPFHCPVDPLTFDFVLGRL